MSYTENYQKWVDVANSLRYNECSDQATMNKKEDTIMKEQSFITAKELAEMLNISTGHAYKVIHRLNDELAQKGYLTFSGRIPRKYLEERCYGLGEGASA